MAKICKECGYPLQGHETICPECGFPIEQSTSTVTTVAKENQQYQQKPIEIYDSVTVKTD